MRETESKPALLVDPKQAARLLAVSPRKLWAMTMEDSPPLPHIRLGRLVRYPVADLERWIADRRQAALPKTRPDFLQGNEKGGCDRG